MGFEKIKTIIGNCINKKTKVEEKTENKTNRHNLPCPTVQLTEVEAQILKHTILMSRLQDLNML